MDNMKIIVLLSITILIFASCRKEFECRCVGGPQIKVYNIKANRYQATKKCKEYTEQEHKLSGGNVGCSIK
ncbi:MAG: hypothetical protein K0S26_500 [Bacteroidota bacterium]|jgi:hypothetical protein|nr:hypothetical protein [Bacteroidota bacterium]